MSFRNFSAWPNAILGTLLVLTGLFAALVTVFARRAGNLSLVTIAAVASLMLALLIVVLVVPPLVRSSRLEFSNLDFPFEITPGGMIFICLLIVVAFAAWNTGNNLLFLIFSLLTSTLFVAWMAARATLRDLVVSARFPDHIFAGEAAPVIVTLRNAKRLLPSFSVLIEARGPSAVKVARKKRMPNRQRFSKRALAYFTYVPRRAAAEQRVEQLFASRGHVLITGFELSTRFPFGFFRRRRRLRARDVDIIVYPKPEKISDELHLLPMNVGQHAVARRGAGHDLLTLRDYLPQDDLRYMDWKATARSGHLIVREFTAEDERRVTIAFDTRPADETEEKSRAARFERGVILAASLIKHFISERAEVRLVLSDEAGSYGTGPEHLYDCLRRLALVTPQTSNTEDQPNHQTDARGVRLESSLHFTDDNYCIILTPATPGSIPAHIWRTSHVIYL